MNLVSDPSRQERFHFYNTLTILLKAVENKKTTIDLRNEAYIFGTVQEVDGHMNVVMGECIFTDPAGNKFKFDTFFVQARNIRCVHIPPNIPMVPVIKEQLSLLNHRIKKPAKVHSLRTKRVKQKLVEDKANMQDILNKNNLC